MSPTAPHHSRLARQHPRAYLVAHAVGGVLLTALLLWGFAAIADAVSEHGILVNTDVAITAFIQAHDTEWGEALFSAISWLGAPVLMAVTLGAIVLYLRRGDWMRATALAIVCAIGTGLNTLLKHVFHRGRPEFATEFIKHQTWSFPSGHAMDSMVGYGMLLVLLLEQTSDRKRRRIYTTIAVLLITVIGFSRVYLGVHYLSDVVGGWLAGGAWLLVGASGYRFARSRLAVPTAPASHDPRLAA